MAPIGEKVEKDDIWGAENEDDEGENLWASILSEVQTSSTTKLPATKSLLVLGDNECGKTTLIAKLQGNEDPKKGAGLEYMYIDVKDEYRDDQTRLGVWLVDGDLHHRSLLKFSLSEDNFEHTLVLLVASLNKPWEIMESLQRWAEVLSTHVDRLRMKPEVLREYEESLVRHFQEYSEPEEGSTATSSSSASTRRVHPNPLHPPAPKTDEEKVLLPLGETTLTHNLGIPIVVVLTKSDAISTLEKEHDYREEHFDFIQQHIRKFCLNYGASLFYTSVKEEKNIDLLSKYLTHRIYGFPFDVPALVVERDAVFVPAGWDTEKKISILYENMTSMKPEDAFEDVIARPVTRKPIQRDAELSAEDEQAFLMKQQILLTKQPAGQRESPMRPTSMSQRQSTSPRVGGSPSATAGGGSPSKKQLDASKGQASEGVLANFFNSLLSKKSGAAGGPPGAPGAGPPAPNTARPTERTAMNRDAAAELDRMTRAKKPTVNHQQNNTAS